MNFVRRPWWGGSDESKRPTWRFSDKALMMLDSNITPYQQHECNAQVILRI
jgi:hypothetical protein